MDWVPTVMFSSSEAPWFVPSHRPRKSSLSWRKKRDEISGNSPENCDEMIDLIDEIIIHWWIWE